MMGIVEKLVSLFGLPKGQKLPAPSTTPKSAYMRGNNQGLFSSWNPILRDSREDVRAAYWQAAARTIDMIHNSGWIAGVVNKGCSAIIGTGLRLSSKPDTEALGWDPKITNEWARSLERRWELWANTALECDAAGKSDVHEMCKAALRSYFATGEWVSWYKWIERPESLSGTKIKLIPAHRLSQISDNQSIYQGVRVDTDGMPKGYLFQFNQTAITASEYQEIKARDALNRRVINHVFDGDVGQMRGISVFAPVLQVLKQYDQLANATLSTALAQAIIAATIESAAPTEEVLKAFETMDGQGLGGSIDCYYDARAGWYDKTNFDLGGISRVIHLFAGEKLDLKRSETPNSNYEPFARFLLREIGACAGFTFEDVTGDYTGATYSSIKMSTTTNWPIQLWRRQHIAAPFYQGAFECWLEEEIEKGRIKLPGGINDTATFFSKNRAALCRADWRGPAKPVPDEQKFASANEKLYSLGVVTAEYIASELGLDIEDVYDQLQREKEMREERGIPDPVVITPVQPAPENDDASEEGVEDIAAEPEDKPVEKPVKKQKRSSRSVRPKNG